LPPIRDIPKLRGLVLAFTPPHNTTGTLNRLIIASARTSLKTCVPVLTVPSSGKHCVEGTVP
jgi:hypothetical protein